MTPEQIARQEIDRQLDQAGWNIQSRSEVNIFAGLVVAIRGSKLNTGSVDYMLYVDGKAAGVIEAKPEGHSLRGVEIQSAKYTDGLPADVPNYRLPLPFAYESTGTVTHFTNSMAPAARSRPVFTFHRRDELVRLLNLEKQLRGSLQEMPELDTGKLWKVQAKAITNLEKSLAENRPRSMIQMATGSGKTYTAVTACYRLIKFAKAKRILFLVDRNNVGRQTLNEFQQFISPYTNYKFTEEHNVQHLKRNTLDLVSKVCITTIQSLYSMLKDEEDFTEANEEGSLFETPPLRVKEPLPVVYNEKIPIETFDFSIIDECRRSIYNLWRQVAEATEELIDINLKRGERLRQSILKRAFDGKLVEQDPTDGPASELLEKHKLKTDLSQNGSRAKRTKGRSTK